jgi:hypothetical protein
MGNEAAMEVYLETGSKRTFAGAVDWPGWCRSGRDEKSALQALLAYGARYAKALGAAGRDFRRPAGLSDLSVVERLQGNATTDFGAPAIPPAADATPVDDAGLERFKNILKACWEAFDAAVAQASGKQLKTGPRGGGRSLEKIIQHVAEAEAAYLARISWKSGPSGLESPVETLDRVRKAAPEALEAAVHGKAPERGPHGGARWTPRYFVRRSAWHILDHAWEIEDRII